jgi:hypothetical protein
MLLQHLFCFCFASSHFGELRYPSTKNCIRLFPPLQALYFVMRGRLVLYEYYDSIVFSGVFVILFSNRRRQQVEAEDSKKQLK